MDQREIEPAKDEAPGFDSAKLRDETGFNLQVAKKVLNLSICLKGGIHRHFHQLPIFPERKAPMTSTVHKLEFLEFVLVCRVSSRQPRFCLMGLEEHDHSCEGKWIQNQRRPVRFHSQWDGREPKEGGLTHGACPQFCEGLKQRLPVHESVCPRDRKAGVSQRRGGADR